MSTEGRANLTPNLVVGLSIMLLGLVLMLDRLGVAEAQSILRFWPVVLILFGASVMLQALRGQSGAPMEREAPIITPGVVFFLVIGVLLVSHVQRRGEQAPRDAEADTVSVFAVMGRDERISLARPFRGGDMTSVLGRTRLDLRNAALASGESAEIDLFGLMGSVVVELPPHWIVDVQSLQILGGVRDARRPAPAPEAAQAPQAEPGAPDALERDDAVMDPSTPPRVVLRGFIMMGRVTIRS